MAKAIEVPNYVKKTEAYVDLMEHGAGTPWEDRGGAGVIPAFFKTVFKSMFAPSSLWNNLRRPETRQDAKWFAIGCGIFWSIGTLIQDLLIYNHNTHLDHPKFDTNSAMFIIVVSLKFLLCPLLLLVFVQGATALYHLMVSHTMKFKAPPTLTFNLFCYSLGPSLFAIIPIVGVWIAGLWILINFIRSGIVRQRITFGTTLTSAIISAGLYALIIFVASWALQYFLVDGLIYPDLPPPPPIMTGG